MKLSSKSILNDMHWISIHIKYKGKLEEFLLSFLWAQLVPRFEDFGIKKFFFVRYFEEFQHVRLRFWLPFSDHDVFLKYFQFSYMEFNSIPFSNFSSDGFFLKAYEPETNRYGGEQAMPIAESIFDLSSKAIIKFYLEEYDGLSNERVLGYACQMHFSMFFGLGWTSAEVSRFLTFAAQKKVSPRSNYRKTEVGSQNLDTQMLRDYYQGLLNGAIPSDSAEIWHRGIKALSQELFATLRSEELTSFFFNILISLMHMNHNRLGVWRLEEGDLWATLSEVFGNG